MKRLAAVEFEACWSRPLDPIDQTNRRGAGHSAVGYVEPLAWPEIGAATAFYLKRQAAFYCHPLWNFGLPTPTLLRELRQLKFCEQRGLAVPRVLAYGQAPGGRALLALESIHDALDLETALAAPGTVRAALLGQVADALVHMHSIRLCHGALYAKHVLVRQRVVRPDGASVARTVEAAETAASPAAQSAVVFIDLEKAKRRVTAQAAALSDLRRFARRTAFLARDDWQRLAQAYAVARMPRVARWLTEHGMRAASA